MRTSPVFAAAVAASLLVQSVHAQFAGSVVSYNSGTGYASGYTTTSSVLGAPALGSSVTPFAAPYQKSQLLSIGAGGEVTVQMTAPIVNNPSNPYGLDFILFANSFFISGGGLVSGLYSHAVSAVVQVSQDGTTWYTLNPSLAPQPGALFPTSGQGNPNTPVNPDLTFVDFSGQSLAGIQNLYNGSAGGTGYDLAWAEDSLGNSVNLGSADYVRVEVQSGVLDLDAISGVSAVPESTSALRLLGIGLAILIPVKFKSGRRKLISIKLLPAIGLCAFLPVSEAPAEVLTQNFTNDPALSGWQVSGDTNLFAWDPAHHALSVTWDSDQTNSYYYHSLSNTLQSQDGFTLDFDLNLSSVDGGTNAAELAVGFINLASATDPSFQRFTGYQSPNIGEFDYFPPSTVYGASLDATTADQYSTFIFNYDFNYALDTGTTYHISLNHNPGDLAVTGIVYTYDTNGALQVLTTLPYNYVESGFTDFNFDTVAVCSYNSADPDDDGSIHATGAMSHISVTTQPRAIGNVSAVLSGGTEQVSFNARAGFDYILQRTSNFSSWTNLGTNMGSAGPMTLTDTNLPEGSAYYRVLARQH